MQHGPSNRELDAIAAGDESVGEVATICDDFNYDLWEACFDRDQANFPNTHPGAGFPWTGELKSRRAEDTTPMKRQYTADEYNVEQTAHRDRMLADLYRPGRGLNDPVSGLGILTDGARKAGDHTQARGLRRLK